MTTHRYRRLRFAGRIAGLGTTSGTRVVVGRWDESPFGPFSDVMIESADGHRVLLAPGDDVAQLVASTYVFDRVRVTPVHVEERPAGAPARGVRHGAGRGGPGIPPHARWLVRAGDLEVQLVSGDRTRLGRVLHLVPHRLAISPAWTVATDPVARTVLRGVRTRGSAGGGRREYYGATDVHAVAWARVHVAGRDLGPLAPVDPPPSFGFGATPRRPSITTLVTTLDVPESDLT